jgi:hypothetical protein
VSSVGHGTVRISPLAPVFELPLVAYFPLSVHSRPAWGVADSRSSSPHRSEGLDPIGTAGCYRGFLLVEVPLPWPRDVGEIEELAVVVGVARQRDLRLQAIIPAAVERLGMTS